MTREESVALYERAQAAEKEKPGEGSKVWNAWAEEMLRRKAELESTGQWETDREAEQAWHESAAADFTKHIFQDANFFGCIFPSTAMFAEAMFSGYAGFGHAAFHGNTWFNEATFQGHARFGRTTFRGGAEFERATFQADADFYDSTFQERTGFGRATFQRDAGFYGAAFQGPAGFYGAAFQRAGFDSATFQGLAAFDSATFQGHAAFNSARFQGDAWFRDAALKRDAGFRYAMFREVARFDGARFEGAARFVGARFQGTARFGNTRYEGGARFDRVHFESRCLFRAARSESGFSVSGADFREVPDFMLATFVEAPRFDDAHICRGIVEPQGFLPRILARVKRTYKSEEDESARFRALKGLAIRGHDHVSELNFFAGEIVCRRGVHDFALPRPWNVLRAWKTVQRPDQEPKRELIWRWKTGEFEERAKVWPGGARYWAGWAYQMLSDFGRSLMRPLFWSAVAFASFTVAYLSRHMAEVAAAPGFARTAAYSMSSFRWAWAKLLSCIPFADFPAPPPLSCASGNPVVTAATEPWAAAVYVSIRRALIFSTGDDQDKLAFAYACLYGDYSEQMPNSLRIVPHIPDVASALAISQSLLSAALIFLFLLAVRNQFRIK